MKKLLCFLMCICLLHGCENKKGVENRIPDFLGFKGNVNTTINDVKIGASVDYISCGKLVLTFSLPESVNGMQIINENGEYKLNYDDLSFSISENGIPYNSICSAIKVCADNIKLATAEGNTYTFVLNGHKYVLTVDDSGNFKELTVDEECVIEFENFEYIMGQTE